MQMSATLPAIEINPKTEVSHCIIWLHGLGADGSDFAPIVPQLHLPEKMGIRFIFPHAPERAVTINQGYKMPAWYDINSLNSDGEIDYEGMMQSVVTIQALIEKEIASGIAPQNIILAGFSQGAVIALLTGIYSPTPISGVIALSGYLPLSKEGKEKLIERKNKFPIFIAHGTEDAVVSYALGKTAYMQLKGANYPLVWHSYAMPHSVCIEELQDLSNWIQTVWS